jgi:hypothetical protein
VFGACEPTVASVGGVVDNGDGVLVGVRHLAPRLTAATS